MNKLYKELTKRNQGYIEAETQKCISETKLLVAGCGIGSTIAEALLRLGFVNLVLVDGDTVEAHNLNRQIFKFADVGKSKAESLKARLMEINPEANVTAVHDWVSADNVDTLLDGVDMVIDSIDFLDVNAIVLTHEAATSKGIPVLSAVSAGFGCSLFFFPGHCEQEYQFRSFFDLPQGTLENSSYVHHFEKFLDKIQDHLAPNIIKVMNQAIRSMVDNVPCPAPHVSPGSFSVAAAVGTMAVRYFAGESIVQSPEFVLVNFDKECSQTTLSMKKS